MKVSELAKWCAEHPNVDVFVSNHTSGEDGEIIDIKYFELEFEVWDKTDPKSHYIINLGELVSG